MKKILLVLLIVLGILSGCATTRTPPDYQPITIDLSGAEASF